jgi:gliding-associated putative ABC transporter substrate-binding component GldG
MVKRRINQIKWLGLIVLQVVVNLIASKFHARYDLTEEKRYSITTATKQLVDSLDENLMIDVFLAGDLPAEFKKLSNSSQEFLSELKEVNPSKIVYRTIDPADKVTAQKTWGDSLQAMGAGPVNVTVQVKAGEESKIIFPYAIVKYKGAAKLVNLFSSGNSADPAGALNNAEAMMEYQFANVIDKVSQRSVASIAYAVGNGEPTGPETFDLLRTVNVNYNFGMFNVKEQPAIPEAINVLLIVKPTTAFTEAEKLKLDQYVMRGGKLVCFIDALHAEQDSLSFKSQLVAYDRGLNIEDLLFNFGVRINPDLLMDLQCDFLPFAVGGTQSNPQYEFLHWNYYPLFESRNNHLINKNLGLVAGRYVNSIDTIEKAGVRKTFLLQSSANSRVISTPALISPNENRNAPEDVLFRKKDIPAAVLLEGTFTSFYKNRIGKTDLDSLARYGGFKEISNNEGKIIVVSDGDIVLNDVSPKNGPLPMGMNLFTAGSQYQYQFANRDFLLNCLEYLTSKTNIIQTRNKEIVLRLLDTHKVNEERTKWQLINIVLPIGLIILFGLAYQQVRRYRFTS